MPNTSNITAHHQLPQLPHTQLDPAPLPTQPPPQPAPIYITYLLEGIMVVNAQNNAFDPANHQGLPQTVTQAVAFAEIPAHQPPHVQVEDNAKFPPQPQLFTSQTIRSDQDDPDAQADPFTTHHTQPCHHFHSKLKVQLVKSQSPFTFICNRQFVGVIVNVLDAQPAAQEL